MINIYCFAVDLLQLGIFVWRRTSAFTLNGELCWHRIIKAVYHFVSSTYFSRPIQFNNNGQTMHTLWAFSIFIYLHWHLIHRIFTGNMPYGATIMQSIFLFPHITKQKRKIEKEIQMHRREATTNEYRAQQLIAKEQ